LTIQQCEGFILHENYLLLSAVRDKMSTRHYDEEKRVQRYCPCASHITDHVLTFLFCVYQTFNYMARRLFNAHVNKYLHY